MKITISGKNIDVTEGLKAAVNEKLGKLEKYFTPDTNVIVTLSVEKERQKIEVTIPVKGNIIRSEQVSNDMYVSIDLVEEVIERQLRKYKNKIADKQQEAGNFQKEYLEHDYLEDEDIQIIRTKKFGMKPMYPEDACVQMELLGHTFFVFRNAETDEVNVVYKRKNNTYGLPAPARRPAPTARPVKQGDFFAERAGKSGKSRKNSGKPGNGTKCLRKIHCYLVPEVVE